MPQRHDAARDSNELEIVYALERVGAIEYGSSDEPDPSDEFYVLVEKINRFAYKKF